MAISATRPSLKELKDSWQNRSYPDENPDSRSLRDPLIFGWLNRPTDTTSPVRLTDLKGMTASYMYNKDTRGAMLPTVYVSGVSQIPPYPVYDEVSTFGGSQGIVRTGGTLQDYRYDVAGEVRLMGYVLPGQSGTYNISVSGSWSTYLGSWGTPTYCQFACIGATNGYLSGSTSQHLFLQSNDGQALGFSRDVTLSESYPYVVFIFYTVIKGNPSDWSSALPTRVADWTGFRCTKL